MTYRSLNEIIEYFDEFIFGFIINDIKNCISARANYVVALALLSYTEFIGGFLRGSFKIGDSKKNFEEALANMTFNSDKHYYHNFKVKFIEGNSEEKKLGIYKIFRCGLVHEYFIKGVKTTVHLASIPTPNTDAGIDWVENNQILRFHCNAYLRDFSNLLKKYYKLLILDKNPILLLNFNKALDMLEDRIIKK